MFCIYCLYFTLYAVFLTPKYLSSYSVPQFQSEFLSQPVQLFGIRNTQQQHIILFGDCLEGYFTLETICNSEETQETLKKIVATFIAVMMVAWHCALVSNSFVGRLLLAEWKDLEKIFGMSNCTDWITFQLHFVLVLRPCCKLLIHSCCCSSLGAVQQYNYLNPINIMVRQLSWVCCHLHVGQSYKNITLGMVVLFCCQCELNNYKALSMSFEIHNICSETN